jgi:CDP-6-deoxy-D-xylo-4-hexulose-3-dehydrase
MNLKQPSYPLASSTWDGKETEAMHEVIRSGQFTMGERVRSFEKKFADMIGTKYAVMVNSGSSANLVLVNALKFHSKFRLNPGDEIIVPAVSWSTTFYPVTQSEFILRFVDVDLDTLNIDVSLIEKAITEKTKAIFAVNLLGNSANWNQLKQLSKKYNLVLLEDNCESLGGRFEDKSLGTFGLGGTFSTFFSHHISTMEGGVVCTDDEELFQIMRSLRAHGWTRDLPDENHVHAKTGNAWDDQFRFVLPGFNLRPLEIEAALGITQLDKLSIFVDTRRANSEIFKTKISRFADVMTQQETGKSSWFGFSMILKGSLANKRVQLVQYLADSGIESRPIVAGNFTKNPVIKHLPHSIFGSLDNSDLIHNDGLFVGNHHYDLTEEIQHLSRVLEDFIGRFGR